MRRITLWLFSTVAAVVLLFSYRTSTGNAAGQVTTVAEAPIIGTPAPAGSATPVPAESATPVPAESATPTPAGSATPTPADSGKTYTGSTAQTRWGPVQVAITVTAGRITGVTVPVYPNGNGRDQEINAYALPVLTAETLTAQNAGIDAVSGATVTSDGYKESLQAAVDAAHLS